MRGWWVLAVLVLGMAGAWANDSSVVGESGRVRRMDGEHATVRMVREWVKVDVYPAYYDVAVQFVFHNQGAATTVRMGFHESGYGDGAGGQETGFQRFQTWVDGQPVKAERLPAKESNIIEEYNTYWVKTVPFARDQTRTVRVEYRSRLGDNTDGERWATYNFTGGNWAGTVAESTLLVTLHLPGSYLINPGQPMMQKGNQLSYRWTNWQAEKGFSVSFIPIRPDALVVRGMHYSDNYLIGEYSRVMVQPGTGPAPLVLPDAINKQGIPFISLQTVADYLNRRRAPGEEPPPPVAHLTWNAATQQATLTVRERCLLFTLKQPVMQVDGCDIPLPAAPFLSTPLAQFGRSTSRLYVPLRPLIDALGSTVKEVNLPERYVAVELK